jgi:hypothetical protein
VRVKLLPFELDMVRVVTRALVPADALDGTTVLHDAGERYDCELATSPWHVALALRASLWMAWLSPAWMLGRPRSFGGVDEATRVLLLERLLKHRFYVVRMATSLLKLTLCMAALGDPAVLRALAAYDLGDAQARRAS